jgi:hypothetical protein
MAAREKLEALLDEVATTLAEQVKSTDENGRRNCAAPALAVAVRLLKDNNIEARAAKGSPLGTLAASLPTFAKDDEDDTNLYN